MKKVAKLLEWRPLIEIDKLTPTTDRPTHNKANRKGSKASSIVGKSVEVGESEEALAYLFNLDDAFWT